jgi:hypothetical protein
MRIRHNSVFTVTAALLIALLSLSCVQPGGPGPAPATEPDPITWTALANGVNGETDSTAIALSFSREVAGLSAADITLSGGPGKAAGGALSGGGKTWSLAVTVETAGDLTIAVAKSGVEAGEKTVSVYKQGAPVILSWTAAANGAAGTETSTAIAFSFSGTVAGLTAEDVVLTPWTGTASKGTLSGEGAAWSLGVSVTAAGSVRVKINKTGIDGEEQTLTVHLKTEDPEDPLPQKTGITIITPPDTTYYGRNQTFSAAGLVVGWVYDTGETIPMAAGDYTVETPDMTKYTPKQVKVRAGAYETSFNIQVVDTDKVLQSVTASGPTNKTQALGLDFDRTGLVVTGHFSDGSTANLASLAALIGYDKFKRGPQTVSVKVNGKTATLEGIVTRIGDTAQAIVNSPGRSSVKNPQAETYKTAYIKGEGMTPAKTNIQFLVSPGGGQPGYAMDSITLSLDNGRLFPEDFTTLTGYNPNQTGSQTLSMTLDGRSFNVEIYVVDAEPNVWFDYGYMRHAGDPTGHGPGAGAYYAQPGETLIIAPVRYLVGYTTDHSDAGATYAWTVSGDAPWTTSKGGELLHVTPAAAGTYTVTVSVTGTSYVTGSPVTKNTSAELVCYDAALPAGTFVSPLKNFGAGQMSEGGTGYGWSLGCAGGYEVWTVDHQASYKIQGNAFGGWHEAGTVWMQEDRNGNGLPDETWHELRGGDEDDPAWKDRITRRYAVTYFKGSDHSTVNEYGQLIREVYWADSKGRTGMVPGGFPSAWGVAGNWVTYTGTLLRDDGNIATGNYDNLAPMPGYADAIGDTFYTSAAMDLAGTPVTLSAVKFIKVQTAVFRYGGLFGDVSTEIKYADFLGTQSLFPDPN